jgi:hypothetical protein
MADLDSGIGGGPFPVGIYIIIYYMAERFLFLFGCKTKWGKKVTHGVGGERRKNKRNDAEHKNVDFLSTSTQQRPLYGTIISL